MVPENMFQKLLVLGDSWRVQLVEYVEKESKVVIRIEEAPALWASESCPHCRTKSYRRRLVLLSNLLNRPNLTHIRLVQTATDPAKQGEAVSSFAG